MPALRLTTLPPSVSRFYRKYGSLNVSQLYGPPRPVNDIALPSYLSPKTEHMITDSKLDAPKSKL
jgi:hypothetical protein